MNDLNYQLVLQFQGDSMSDFDSMVELEDELSEKLGDSAAVDGHDIGSGETNIFIYTSDPVATFQRTKSVLECKQKLKSVTVAYRVANSERYTVIWPEDAGVEFRVL